MRWIVWTLVVLLCLVGAVAIVGWMLPQDHEASRSARFNQSPERLYASMQQQVQASQAISRARMEVVQQQPPSRLVMRVAPGQAFGGTWTFELVPEDSGTRLTITERGEIYNPIFRFLSRFVLGYTATMEDFLTSLAARVGEEPRR